MYALALLAVGLVPQSVVVEDRCDVVEVNHFYDAEGEKVFTQAIFWDWHNDCKAHRVAAWRLLKEPLPYPQRSRHGWEMTWWDGTVLRRVRSQSMRVTYTQRDPELRDREFLPSCQRRGLPK